MIGRNVACAGCVCVCVRERVCDIIVSKAPTYKVMPRQLWIWDAAAAAVIPLHLFGRPLLKIITCVRQHPSVELVLSAGVFTPHYRRHFAQGGSLPS